MTDSDLHKLGWLHRMGLNSQIIHTSIILVYTHFLRTRKRKELTAFTYFILTYFILTYLLQRLLAVSD